MCDDNNDVARYAVVCSRVSLLDTRMEEPSTMGQLAQETHKCRT